MRNDETNWALLDGWKPDLGIDAIQNSHVDDVLDGWDCEDWLFDAASELASSSSVVARAASLGIIGRLWEPADSWHTKWKDDPNSRIISILRSYPLSVFETVESIACVHATSMFEIESYLELAFVRDDLESVFWVLTQVGMGQSLGQVLAVVDISLAYRSRRSDDPRLKRVALLEPNAWWT